MAAQRQFHCFLEDLACGVHVLRSDVLKIALVNVRPDVAADAILDDIGEVEPGHGYEAGGKQALVQHFGQEDGVLTLTLAPVVFEAVGDDPESDKALIGPFQWAVLYNSSVTMNGRGVKGHPLICAWEYRKEIDLAHGETFRWQTPQGRPVLKIAVPGQ